MSRPVKSLAFGQFDRLTDIGSVELPGSCKYDPAGQAYTIRGSGANIGGEHDAFCFLWKRLSGDFILTLRAEFSGPGANPHRKLGWMCRAGLESDSPHISAVLHGDGLTALQFRRLPGGSTVEVRSPVTGPDVLQLERKGNTFILSAAKFGQALTSVQAQDIPIADPVYIGLFVCSHDPAVLEQAVFQDIRIVVPVRQPFDPGRERLGSRLEVLDLDTGHRRNLYSADSVFEAPNWTRDGRALIYNAGGRLFHYELTTGRRTLIDTGDAVWNNNDHVLSFDGSRLGISSHSPDHRASRIYTLPVEGGRPKLVTRLGPSYLHGWSPDGRFLVYCAERKGHYDVYRIPVDGGEEVQLTDTPGLDDGPEYTPDGNHIYFNSVRSGSMQIWRMRPDGSHPEQITDDEYNNWFAHVSPDGKWIAFVSYLPGEVQPGKHPPARRVYLRLLPVDGGTPKVIAYVYGGQGTLNVPSWSPDGRRLAFVSNTVPYL